MIEYPERTYSATIKPYLSGVWKKWVVTYHYGIGSIGQNDYTRTREQAEAKAKKRITEWKRQDDLKKNLTFTVTLDGDKDGT